MNRDEAKERDGVMRMQENSLTDARRRYDRLIDLATTDAIKEDVFRAKSQKLQQEIDVLERKVELANDKAADWRQSLTEVIDTIAHCRERFEAGDAATKKIVVQSLGSKYVLKDGKIILTPHDWLVPIHDGYSKLEEQFNEVRSAPKQIRIALLEAVRISWRRRGDSNSRSRSLQTNDLANHPLKPLGYPSVYVCAQLTYVLLGASKPSIDLRFTQKPLG